MTAVFCISVIFQIFCIPSFIYRTRRIITHGLYNSNPLFVGKNVSFKEFFSENSAFLYDYYQKGFSNQERILMARVRLVVY